MERTIGLLKARWRCLLGHRVLHYDPAMAAKIVNACVCLHNIANERNAPIPGDDSEVGINNQQQDILGIDDAAALRVESSDSTREQLVR